MPLLKSNLLNYSTDKREKLSTLVDLLHYRGQYQPDKQAYIFLQNGETESGSLTYGELDKQARAIAFQLQFWQGERALLLYPSGLEFITAFFGCLYAGLVNKILLMHEAERKYISLRRRRRKNRNA